jgi:succinoglycan biosynthesis transport protein ExoP
MPRGRSRLPVLAEISGPADGTRGWSLRGGDFAALEKVLPRLEGNRVVIVSGEGEAASVAAIGLGSAAAAAGRLTIVVECDLAEPRLAAQLGLSAAPGLHEYLRWEAEPQDVLQPIVLAGPAAATAQDPLVCICAGRPAAKAETLLGLQSFAHMVEKLRGAYELVLVIGASPVTEPGPCLAAARHADGVVAGLSGAAATGRAGRDVRAAIRRLPAPVLGTLAVAKPQ